MPLLKQDRLAAQFALGLAAFMVPFMSSSLNLAIPYIGRDFSMSAFSLTFLVSTYLLGAAVFQMPAARVGDILGRRRVFLAGIAVFAVSSLASGLAWSGAALIALRLVAGLGSAMIFATMMAILTVLFPKEVRGRVLGANTAITYLALSVGPFIGGVLAEHLGWRSIFFLCFILLLVAAAAARRGIREEWADSAGEPYDYPGGILYIVGVGGLVFGFSHLPGAVGWSILALGLVALPAFVVLENRRRFPVLKLDIFHHNRHFRLAAISAMINYSASFAVSFLLSLYLQFIKEMRPDHAGFVLMAQPLSMAVLSPLAGRLSDRVNPSWLTTGGMAAISAGLFLLSGLTAETSLTTVVAILVLIGVGFALFSSPNVNIIMSSVSSRNAGLASATTGTARLIGQALSIATTSLIVHACMGDHEMARETAILYLPAMHAAFLVFAAVCLIGVYTSASKLFGGEDAERWRHSSVRVETGADGPGGGR